MKKTSAKVGEASNVGIRKPIAKDTGEKDHPIGAPFATWFRARIETFRQEIERDAKAGRMLGAQSVLCLHTTYSIATPLTVSLIESEEGGAQQQVVLTKSPQTRIADIAFGGKLRRHLQVLPDKIERLVGISRDTMTIADIARLNPNMLLGLKNFGVESVRKLHKIILEHGCAPSFGTWPDIDHVPAKKQVFNRSDLPVTDEDWEKINQAIREADNSSLEQAMDILRKSDPASAMQSIELQVQQTNRFKSYNFVGSANHWLCKAKLPFRIVYTSHPEQTLKVVKGILV